MEYGRIENLVIEKLQNLPSEISRDYELFLTDLIMDKDDEIEIDNVLNILNNQNENVDIRYACFVMATIYHRRNKNMNKFNELIFKYKKLFENRDSYNHYYLLSFVDTGYTKDWRDILKKAEDNSKTMNQSGAYHMFAEFVAMFFEDERSDENKKESSYYITSGLEAVNKALRESPNYAKFYATRGRLLALEGKYQEAKDDIQYAITIEDSKRSDYSIRIGNYQARLINVQQKINTEKLQNTMNAYRDEQNALYDKTVKQAEEISGSLTRNLEYLGIFAGIISFTMGSISIAGSVADKTLVGAAALIIVLFGALSGTYFIFDIIIHGFNKDKKGQYCITGIIILIAIIGGLALCFLI